jgi:hypothetical protein
VPALPPGLEPIPLDEAAAYEAVDACRRVATAVDAAAETRQRAAVEAQREWRGPARDEFDVGLARVQGEAVDLAADLRAMAGAISRAVDDIRAENVRRAAERAQWAANLLAAGG